MQFYTNEGNANTQLERGLSLKRRIYKLKIAIPQIAVHIHFIVLAYKAMKEQNGVSNILQKTMNKYANAANKMVFKV